MTLINVGSKKPPINGNRMYFALFPKKGPYIWIEIHGGFKEAFYTLKKVKWVELHKEN